MPPRTPMLTVVQVLESEESSIIVERFSYQGDSQLIDKATPIIEKYLLKGSNLGTIAIRAIHNNKVYLASLSNLKADMDRAIRRQRLKQRNS